MHVRRHSGTLALALVLATITSPPLVGQLAPPSNGGMVELDRLLQQLAENRRVLLIAAHPDDEDTALLSLLSRGYGVRAAYLALSRGEGGQNLIGPELGPQLGIIRSRELLAARELDGAEQFFTRAYDFGYTRSLDETSGLWLPDSILKDVVRVVRSFKPHVIVSTFSGTARDGHGQHQAAGVAARAAFDAAGDASRFPELETEEGLTPWTPVKLYRSIRFNRQGAGASLEMSTGMLDPRVGQSYHQIAMASRSRHRSQDMGTLQQIGPQQTRLLLEVNRADNGPADAEEDIFSGIPLESNQLVRFAAAARAAVDATNLSALTPGMLLQLPEATGRERELLDRAVGITAGLVIDAVVADEKLTPGQTVSIDVSLFNSGPYRVGIEDVSIATPDGWAVAREDVPAEPLQSGAIATVEFRVTVPRDAVFTQPYFLERAMVGSMYDWSATPPDVRGRPFQPPLLEAKVVVSVLSASVSLSREATYRTRNQAAGEVRREVRVVPLVDVKVDPGSVVWSSTGATERDFTVSLFYNGRRSYAGEVTLEIDGWPAPESQRFTFEHAGESARFVFSVGRPPNVSDASVEVRAIAIGGDQQRFDVGVEMVEYPHIRPTALVHAARSSVHVTPMTMPTLSRVGYVRGAADRVPEALRQIGVPLEILDGDRLAQSDLSVFDAIVVGSRAYEADSALTEHNERLMAYTRSGGLLIVQYQQYQFIRGGYAPHPLEIGRPHDRVTDETAPVRILRPDSPLFNTPNRIGATDWVGWPQERGLYFAGTWDDAYVPQLEMNDAGRPPLQGGLLVARYGAGTYVYTGLSFFRALPAGTPGAFRLFLNLLGLKPDHVQ
ncbi:MAG: PIG-L family deacetylase [Gemmatimonadales bacterium]